MNKHLAVAQMRKEGLKGCTDGHNNVCVNVLGNGEWFLIRLSDAEVERWVDKYNADNATPDLKEQVIKIDGRLNDGTQVKGEALIHVEDGSGGSFELWDINSDGSDYYVAGELEIEEFEEGYALLGYDGCYVLPQLVIDAVKSAGIGIEI